MSAPLNEICDMLDSYSGRDKVISSVPIQNLITSLN